MLARQTEAEATPILTGFRELSEGAFAVWIRLCAGPVVPRRGRAALARELGYSRATFDRRLRELRDLGYIRLVMHGDGKRTDIILAKRALALGINGIAKV